MSCCRRGSGEGGYAEGLPGAGVEGFVKDSRREAAAQERASVSKRGAGSGS